MLLVCWLGVIVVVYESIEQHIVSHDLGHYPLYRKVLLVCWLGIVVVYESIEQHIVSHDLGHYHSHIALNDNDVTSSPTTSFFPITTPQHNTPCYLFIPLNAIHCC